MTATCKRGHPRTPENTAANRACKPCLRERAAERLRTDPEWAERRRAQSRDYGKARYAVDAEFREQAKRRARGDAESRTARNRRMRERYANDAEFRAAKNAQNAASRRKRMDDPERSDDYREYNRIYLQARRREAGIPERNWSPTGNRAESPLSGTLVSVGPLGSLLDAWKAANPGTTWEALARRVDVSSRSLLVIRTAERPTVSLAVVSRILDGMGHPEYMNLLYPVDGSEPVIPDIAPAVRRSAIPPTTCRSGDGCPRPTGHGPNGRFCEKHGPELDRVFATLNPKPEDEGDYNKRRRKAFVNGVAHRVEVVA